MNLDDNKRPFAIPAAELREFAAAVAEELQSASADAPAATGGGSAHRALPAKLQERFIDCRAALFQRGIYDPVLVRFDTATVPQASTREIGERLAAIADGLMVHG